MTLDPSAPAEYIVGHLEDALARDPRVSEQGLRVQISGPPTTVVISGTVVAAERKPAVFDVVHELLPDAEVRDETTVGDYPEGGAPEVVR